MERENEHYRHILLYYFRKGKNASQAYKKLYAVYGDKALKERQCRNWFVKFRSGDFSLKDNKRSGRAMDVDDNLIKSIIATNRHSTTREIAEKLNVSHTCIEKHLQQLGFSKKLDIWVPHELKEIHLAKRIDICDMLLKRNENEPFLKRIITGDEKWVVYNNITRKRSWSQPNEPPQTTSKPDIHQKKVLLSVWWDYKGIVYFELLPRNQTINSEVYIDQLTKLDAEIKKNRPELANRKGIVFHHDNARPHTSLTTRQKLLQLGWDVLPHPPYSPDIAPSDFYLFQNLQNFLQGKKFNNDYEVKLQVTQFFASKNPQFYEHGIMMLPEKWKKVIENNGQYIFN